MIYPIFVYGQPVLRKVASNITPDYKGLDALIEDMYQTMYKAEGIGLAAPQIGLPIRIFVVDGSPLAEDHPELENFKKVFINAKIIERNDTLELESEGCLSLPKLNEEVSRPTAIRIQYQDENFNSYDEKYEGFAARVLQHEYDHIEGKLFIDYLSPLRRRLLKSKLTSITKGDVDIIYRIKTI